MPRITATEQFRRHRFVRMVANDESLKLLLTLLSPRAQWDLHRYYCGHEDFDEISFEAYRRQVEEKEPSLGHKAGKHFRVLEQTFITASRVQGYSREQMYQAVTAQQRRTVPRATMPEKAVPMSSRVRVSAVVRPQIDAELLAKALIMASDSF